MVSHLESGRWSEPQIAPFSGAWNDQHPTMAPDGSYLLFVSTRPVPGLAQRVAHLWRVDRRGYAPAQKLPFSTPATADVDPEIAPDQSFMIFASSGRRRRGGTTMSRISVPMAARCILRATEPCR